jgi:hypothetical protein
LICKEPKDVAAVSPCEKVKIVSSEGKDAGYECIEKKDIVKAFQMNRGGVYERF